MRSVGETGRCLVYNAETGRVLKRCSMNRIFIVPLTAAILLFSLPLHALDFTAADFDPKDPSMIDVYRLAVSDLMDELSVEAIDDEGSELFSVVPFPMELVALMAQMEIHSLESDDPAEIDSVIERANNNKPGANSFAFLLDGDPEWVSGNVRMVYVPPDGAESDRVEMEVVPIGEGEESDGNMVAEWMVVVEDPDLLMDFLASPQVILVIEKAGGETKELDCGFWRQWGLFDLRMEEEQEESQPDPTSP